MDWEGSLRNVAKKCNSNAILEIINSVPDSQWKADTEKRDSNKVDKALKKLDSNVKSNINLLDPIIYCIKAHCTLGEITCVLKSHFGEHS